MEWDLRDFLTIIKKRKWIIIIIVLISSLSTGYYSYFISKPVYQASTKLIVNKTAENKGIPQLNYNDVNTNLHLIKTYVEIIKTPTIMKEVATKYLNNTMSVEQLIKNVKVSSVNDTQVMTIQTNNHSYIKATEIVNAVSEVFKKKIQQIMKVDNVTILNKANPKDHPKPISPMPVLNIIVSIFLSILLSFAVVYFVEYMDDTINAETDMENYLKISSLGIICKIEKKDFFVSN